MTWFSPATAWSSGPWSLELRDDEFADIAYDGTVVLRSVRAVVRDRNWDTARLVVDDVELSETAVALAVHSEGLGSSFRGSVRAEVQGARLVVSCDLATAEAFDTNRTGLVVLHTPRAAGAPVEVMHPPVAPRAQRDETLLGSERTSFPRAVSPHQPVFDIAELAWSESGLDIDVRFDGDVFEMEDQRNWTDASFKTYSRPLGLPFPYALAAGEHVVQSVALSVSGSGGAAAASAPADAVALTAGAPLPVIALGASTAPDPAPAVSPLGSEVLVELDLASGSWRAALARAAASDLPLDVRIVRDHTADVRVTEAAAALVGRNVVRVAIFDREGPARHVSPADTVASLREALAAAGVEVPVVGGSRSHFTELNREFARLPGDLDGIVFATTPLFHASGTEQLVEALAMQRLVAEQAVRMADGLPVHIGPVALRPRYNDVATSPQPVGTRTDLAEGYGAELQGVDDARQDAEELGAWTIAGAAALGVEGVATIAYFEEWGARGVRTASGADRPVAAAVRELAALGGQPGLRGSSADGLVWALGARTDLGDIALVANLDRVARTVAVSAAGGGTASVALEPGAWARVPLGR